MRTHVRYAPLLMVALFMAKPSTGLAQRAAYARPDELRGEGLSHHLDVNASFRYAQVLDPSRVQGLNNIASFSLRARAFLGRNPTYCTGLDGDIGAGDTGVAYGLTGYAVGLGARWGLGSVIALCGGAGFNGVVGSMPLAARFPAELSLGLSLGPVRINLWGALAWTPLNIERHNGSSTMPFADEFEAGFVLRDGRQHRLWTTANAGSGPSVGVVYREFMNTRFVAVVLGLDLTGAR